MNPQILSNFQNRFQNIIQKKNEEKEQLQLMIHQSIKAYNDQLRVFEAKLVGLGVPSEELLFDPIPTITSQAPN